MRLETGQEVDGRYQLVGRIGSGGMADVWCADDRMLSRRVALKFLHERFAQDHHFVERFRREASAAAGLQHPNVVSVFDRGDWNDLPYIAMEYVEGASLKELIARGLSIAEAVEIVRQVLQGARFAHRRGIVHRDLKPQNILVDRDGRAHVTDFGIAKAGASEITQAGAVLGTAQYLSPEQAQGLEVTPASDLYSIGVVLYEALTGSVPFEGESAVTIALKQVSERPRPPSELNPAVPRALDAVVLRALAKDPVNRFGSADEFSAALDAAEAEPSGATLGDTAAYAAAAALPGVGAPGTVGDGYRGTSGAPAGGPWGWFTRRRLVLLGLLLLALIGTAVFALTRPNTALVPGVVGEKEDRARVLLEAAGFEVAVQESPRDAPVGTVFEQDPGGGESADKGSTVTITVSVGLGVGEVPRVARLTERQAIKTLRDADFEVASRPRFDRDIPDGRAIGTEPPAGTELRRGRTVTLFVSKGPRVVEMPDVVGEQEDVAESTLEDLRLVVDMEPRHADEPEGTVIAQRPGPGTTVPRGERVTIVVSTGRGSVIMPNVVGRSKDAARDVLRSRGLKVDVVKQATNERREDERVLEQAPNPGTRLRKGDTVTIFVGAFGGEPPPDDNGPGPPPPPPDDDDPGPPPPQPPPPQPPPFIPPRA